MNIPRLKHLQNGRVWYMACLNFGALIGLYTLSFWVPQLLKSRWGGYSNGRVGLLVAIPHLVGLVAMSLVAWSSDRKLERRYHAAIPILLAGIALLFHEYWAFSVGPASPAVGSGRRLLLSHPFISLPSEFLSGYSAAAGLALINSIGNLSGFAQDLI